MAPTELALLGTRTTKGSFMATTESSAPAHPSAEDQDHPHACLNGYVYLGYTALDEETGEEVERIEALPCRRCAEEAR
jgi:hypothetical protein